MKRRAHNFGWGLLIGAAIVLLWTPPLMHLAGNAQGETLEFTAPEASGADGKAAVSVLEETGEKQTQSLEDYLTGVVLGEIPADFEAEALKAQAVAARTYTRKAQLLGGKHGDGSLCRDPGCCQAYWDPGDYLDRGGSPENLERVRAAVRETDDLVLSYRGELIEATYFACSGGRTEAAVAVWGTDYPYLRAADSPGEENAMYFRDTKWAGRQELEEALGISLPEDPSRWLGAVARTSGGGVDWLELGGVRFPGTVLRQKLGLRSTAFEAAPEADGLLFETRGFGHRVGLSQYGAQAMAKEGADFAQILQHYYPGTSIGKYVELFTQK